MISYGGHRGLSAKQFRRKLNYLNVNSTQVPFYWNTYACSTNTLGLYHYLGRTTAMLKYGHLCSALLVKVSAGLFCYFRFGILLAPVPLTGIHGVRSHFTDCATIRPALINLLWKVWPYDLNPAFAMCFSFAMTDVFCSNVFKSHGFFIAILL